MNIKSNFSMPLMEFGELKAGDCFAWIGEADIGPNVFMKIGDIETNKETIKNAYVDLETGEVNVVGSLYTDGLVLLIKLNATADLSTN